MTKSVTAEYKRIKVPFLVKKDNLTETDDFFHFEGYASTFGNTDRDNDVMENGAFANSIQKLIANGDNLPILWQHNMDMPLGIYLSFTEDNNGLFVKGKMPKSDTFVKGRVIPQMQIGSVRKMSIGFFITDSEFQTTDDNKTVRVIKDVDLLEVSLVTIPANDQADVTNMKSATPYGDLPLAERGMAWSKDDALGRVRVKTDSKEKPSATYKKAFFWYDEKNEEMYGSYKLPFADVVGGELKAVPRGVFAVAAALRGARGGVNIPDADKQKIISNLNKYYAKMRKDFQDDSIISPFEENTKESIIGAKKLSDIEKIFKSHCFTNKESEMLISKITELKAVDQPRDSSHQSDSDEGKTLAEIQETLSTLKQELS